MNPGAGLFKGLWKIFSLLVKLVVAILLLALVLLNVQQVPINMLFDTHWELPLSLVMLLCLIAGLLLGGGLILFAQWHGHMLKSAPAEELAQIPTPPVLEESFGEPAGVEMDLRWPRS